MVFCDKQSLIKLFAIKMFHAENPRDKSVENYVRSWNFMDFIVRFAIARSLVLIHPIVIIASRARFRLSLKYS